MFFKHRAWIPAAWIFALGNVVSAVFAGPAEPLHASTHVLLAVLAGLGAKRLEQRRKPSADGDLAVRVEELEARLADFGRLPDVESRIAELEERLDFTERAMVEVRSRSQLPPQK